MHSAGVVRVMVAPYKAAPYVREPAPRGRLVSVIMLADPGMPSTLDSAQCAPLQRGCRSVYKKLDHVVEDDCLASHMRQLQES